MTAWGTGSFDNDEAMDWACDLAESGDLAMVEHALDVVLDEEDYLEVDLGEQAIAAAEVVAALLGSPADDLPEEVRRWLRKHEGLDGGPLRRKALEALDRITASASELHELWEESDAHLGPWKDGVKGLRRRLTD